MAWENFPPLEVLDAMQGAGVEDRVRTAVQTIYQVLIRDGVDGGCAGDLGHVSPPGR